jgi:hypothetical protein
MHVKHIFSTAFERSFVSEGYVLSSKGERVPDRRPEWNIMGKGFRRIALAGLEQDEPPDR